MDNYSKKAHRIFQYCSLLIIAIGVVMAIVNTRATGKAGGKSGSTNVSYSGWQIASVGAILYIMNYFQEHKKNRNRDN